MRKQLLLALGVVVIVIGIVMGWYLMTQRHISRLVAQEKQVNILVSGLDNSENTDYKEAILLMSVAPNKKVVFVSIPSNLHVKLDDNKLYQLSAVYSKGGITLSHEAVEKLLGIDIPFYITADHASYETLISRIGGITIEVDQPFHYNDDSVDPPVQIDIQPGEHTLDGKGALEYIRYRREDETNREIIQRQQEVLTAILRDGFHNTAYDSIQKLIRDVKPDIKTNLSLADLYDLARILNETDMQNVQMATLPTTAILADDITNAQLQVVQTEEMIARLIRGIDLLTASDISVAVFNGNGKRLLASRTADYLRSRNFVVNNIANAETFDYSMTYIIPLTDISKAQMLKSALPQQHEAIIALPAEVSSHYEALFPYTPSETDLLFIAGEGFDVNE